MDNNLAIPASNLGVAELNNLSTQALRAELAKALTISAQVITYLAQVWAELERRGEDLADLRNGLAQYLPLVASGQLCADVVVRFANNRAMVDAISRLPIDEQRRMAAGGEVNIITPAGNDGEYTVQTRPATSLTSAQARLVFDIGRIRNTDEQRAILDSRQLSPSRRTKNRPITIDRAEGTAKIGRQKIKLSDLFAAIAESSTPSEDIPKNERKSVMIFLSESEHRALKSNAALSGRTMEDIVRSTLLTTGAI